MSMARLLAIGAIALTTMTQTGWGQVTNDRREQQLVTELMNLQVANAALVDRLKQAGIDVEPYKPRSPYINVEFHGGTLGELITELKEQRREVNIILEPGAGDVRLPPFQAFGVTPAGAIWVAKSVAGPDWNLQIETVDPRDGSASTTIVRASESRNINAALSSSAPSRAWNLTRWVGDDPDRIDATFAAIQVGLESFGDSPIELKYHEPTGVLMARGNQAQVDFIDSIIKAASEASTPRASLEVLGAPGVIKRSSERLVEVEGEIMVLEAQTEVFKARIEGMGLTGETKELVAEQRVELASVEARIAKLRFEQEQLREAVKRAREALAEHEASKKP